MHRFVSSDFMPVTGIYTVHVCTPALVCSRLRWFVRRRFVALQATEIDVLEVLVVILEQPHAPVSVVLDAGERGPLDLRTIYMRRVCVFVCVCVSGGGGGGGVKGGIKR